MRVNVEDILSDLKTTLLVPGHLRLSPALRISHPCRNLGKVLSDCVRGNMIAYAPKSNPEILVHATRSHTNHVVRSSPSATTIASEISPEATAPSTSSYLNILERPGMHSKPSGLELTVEHPCPSRRGSTQTPSSSSWSFGSLSFKNAEVQKVDVRAERARRGFGAIIGS